MTRYLLFTIFFYLGQLSVQAQSEAVQCDLVNLYQITLDKSPTLQRQNIQYRISEVDKRSASSAFDYQLFSDLSLDRAGLNLFDLDPRTDIVGGKINTNRVSLSGGIQRTFRSGITASAALNYLRVGDNFPFNAYNENVGEFVSDNITSASVSVRQPLLRGRGRYMTTANEKAAGIGVEGQQLNTKFVASGEVLTMVASYWQYLAAEKSLMVYRGNEERVRKVLSITEELVKADKKPSSELLQIQADLMDKERQTIAARQRWFSAQQNLGRAIGMDTGESTLLGTPKNNFPEIENVSTDLSLQSLLNIAYENRTDLKSIKKSLDILSIYIDVAENNAKPQLDLTASFSYGGVDAGNSPHRFITALGKEEGRNYQAGIGVSYIFPIQNNFAEANLLSNQLQFSDREVQLKNQIRNIELNVSIAYNNLKNSIDAVNKSKQSLDYYTQVFENEQYKFQTGLTTLLNLILFQERLTFAQLDYINNQQQLAIAISNLRYETGTIFSDSNDFMLKDNSENPEIFYTLPRE